jgi:hypothetical protein
MMSSGINELVYDVHNSMLEAELYAKKINDAVF